MTSSGDLKSSIENLQCERESTHYWNDFLHSYLKTDKLKEFYSDLPVLENLPLAIERKKDFSTQFRSTLVEVLKEQYAKSGIDTIPGPVNKNIELLRNSDTFTITTGQQIHVGLGPLYVLYKILNTLQLTEDANQKYSDYKFVPVFWMASEDHDLEEIRDIKLFGKTFSWNTDQKGAVGRMSTEGINTLIDDLIEEVRPTEAMLKFFDLAKESYKGRTLADASRYFLNALFGELGLVILDADHPKLKKEYTSVLKAELKGEHLSLFQAQTEELDEKGFDPQVYIRDVNLFWLSENDRSRIEIKGDKLVSGDEVLSDLDDIEAFVDKSAESLSPNVALRPLYQEQILPNLLYVGGPSEVKYWLQFKSVFDAHDVPFPLLFLRTSAVLLNPKQWEKLKLENWKDLYLEEESLVLEINKIAAQEERDLSGLLERARANLDTYNSLFDKYFKGYSVDSKIQKILPKLDELDKIAAERFIHRSESNPLVKQTLKIKRGYFSTGYIQEREAHIAEYAYILEYLQDLKKHFGFSNLLKINHLINK
ncbi:bacillithiol biosynthesis cysteine-adding enzyme BshC [bacterium]|nr:bacillithiol biosynthesis cysteine-adding enzyme BshC [bacterium]